MHHSLRDEGAQICSTPMLRPLMFNLLSVKNSHSGAEEKETNSCLERPSSALNPLKGHLSIVVDTKRTDE